MVLVRTIPIYRKLVHADTARVVQKKKKIGTEAVEKLLIVELYTPCCTGTDLLEVSLIEATAVSGQEAFGSGLPRSIDMLDISGALAAPLLRFFHCDPTHGGYLCIQPCSMFER